MLRRGAVAGILSLASLGVLQDSAEAQGPYFTRNAWQNHLDTEINATRNSPAAMDLPGGIPPRTDAPWQSGQQPTPINFDGVAPSAVLQPFGMRAPHENFSAPNMVGSNPGQFGKLGVNSLGEVSDTGGQVFFGQTILDIPSPGGGWRQGVAENNSAIPRDRVFATVSHARNTYRATYDAVQTQLNTTLDAMNNQVVTGITTATPRVLKKEHANRFQLGFEKTFFQERASLDVRLPFSTKHGFSHRLVGSAVTDIDPAFAGTRLVQSNWTDDISAVTLDEFGRVAVNLKTALLQRRFGETRLLVSGGIGFEIPLGSVVETTFDSSRTETLFRDFEPNGIIDQTAIQGNDANLLKFQIKDDAAFISPFLAFLLEEGDHLWLQGFIEYDTPTSENSVVVTESRTTLPPNVAPVGFAGQFGQRSLLNIDVGAGYWVYRSDELQWLTGVAPFFEVHYSATMDSSDFSVGMLNDPNRPVSHQFGLFQDSDDRDVVNLTFGCHVELVQHANFRLAGVFPTRGRENRDSDAQIVFQFDVTR